MPGSDPKPRIHAYILAKNEEPNIRKCLASLEPCGIPVVLLDSGSTDRTREIAQGFPFCEVKSYAYVDHATAYNAITSGADNPYALILDADMEITPGLWSELTFLTTRNDWDVVRAPVRFHVEGHPLSYGSLCPPKPIFFRRGKAYFVPRGHGEALSRGSRVRTTRSRLAHNDLKPYEAYLLSQVRYGRNLAARSAAGQASIKDRLRASTPLMAVVYPLVSLVFRGGLFAGRLGLMYALDRAIAVLVQYRVVLASKVSQIKSETPQCTTP